MHCGKQGKQHGLFLELRDLWFAIEDPITEDTPQIPVNPYGETKLVIERALRWYGVAHNISWARSDTSTRPGADGDGEIGEAHNPETHLIPLVLDAALGRRMVEFTVTTIQRRTEPVSAITFTFRI